MKVEKLIEGIFPEFENKKKQYQKIKKWESIDFIPDFYSKKRESAAIIALCAHWNMKTTR